MEAELIGLEAKKSRDKVLERFCIIISVLSAILTFTYLYENMHLLAVLCGVLSLIFVGFIFLSRKKGAQRSSRILIISTSIVAVIIFSIILGFKSGIYMYLFIAPLLTYLLYNYNELKKLFFIFTAYIATFLLIYSIELLGVEPLYALDSETLEWIYVYNLWSTFVLSFSIVTYFAATNFKYINGLKSNQAKLEAENLLRKKGEKLLKDSLKDREELLAEIHHRVKNNLAIITALINLQMSENSTSDKVDSHSVLLSTKNRIYAISLVYNLIYRSKSLDQVDFGHFIKEFFGEVKKDLDAIKRIDLDIKIDENCRIDLNRAVPLALIFNEVLCNCIANIERTALLGNVKVEMRKKGENNIIFTVGAEQHSSDVLQCEFDKLGQLIVSSLTEQLDANVELSHVSFEQFKMTFSAN